MRSSRPRLAVVSAVAPAEQSTSGFASRLRHFLLASADEMDVSLVLVRFPEQQEALDPDAMAMPFDVHVLDAPVAPWNIPGPRGKLARALLQYPFDPLPFQCYPRRWPTLRHELLRAAPDIVGFYLPYLSHLANHASDSVPVIGILEERWECVIQDSIEGPSWKQAWLSRREAHRYQRVYRRLGRRAQAVVAISAEEKAHLSTNIDAEKITVIPHGIDTTYFAPGAQREHEIDVLVVGDLRARRNALGALSAWETARCRSDAKEWRWAFVGAVNEDLAARLREGGALVTGRVEDVRPYYERARAVLVPSLAGGGVKTTSLQAWAMGRPLVATPVGAQGLPAQAGLNVLIGESPGALVDGLLSVIRNPDRARQLGAAGRLTAQRERDLAALGRLFARLCLDTAAAARVRV